MSKEIVQLDLKEEYSYWKREFSFGVEDDLQNKSPSVLYFWHRKTNKVVELVRDNIDLFSPKDRESQKLFVELGCGHGVEIFAIRSILEQKKDSFKYVGFEGAPKHLELCNLRRRFHLENCSESDNISFSWMDFAELKFPSHYGQADFLYCSEVIEHIPEPEKFLSKIHEFIAPGGYLILTTPNEPNVFQRSFWSSKRRKKMLKQVEQLRETPRKFTCEGKEIDVYGHVSCKTIQAWEEILKNTGFELVDFRRGAITHGHFRKSNDQSFLFGARLLVEAAFDLLPNKMSRPLSGQLIGLYRKR
ncbi:Ubiquinone biosynthesis O-methyltransferase [Acaryochloris thomasi RCC1774]|uniref:Ubiquinone biosynthesis O-methyltransferase n=1 Tax=Acaryochloris thomasi RCC1774 TaxID=1764569 RepID=A0A2W1JSW4_9CYAN|nr:class I SAM-dependent methyltransferase [Acaryochloris thomasi]PZD74235.1 Ubiquinone biosynthesis O-methyltransferase [Acaryochloris thomasi RCC1774]